jgi:alpha-glucosidase
MELGVFNPIYRNHAAKGTRDREPWVDGPEHEAIRKRYIETRYRLLPYIYTGMEEASRTGVPLMRPMFMEFPDEAILETNGEEYMFGRGLLVAPKTWPFVGNYDVTLPSGEWFNYWTGERIAPAPPNTQDGVTGGQKVQVQDKLDTLPVYVRAGTILPQQPVVQNVDETPKGPLELRIFPGPNCGGELYMDDGNTFAYQKGEFLRVHFTCEAASSGVKVHISAADGPYHPWFQQIQVTVYGNDRVSEVSLDGQPAKGWKAASGAVTLTGIPWTGAAHDVQVQYKTQ